MYGKLCTEFYDADKKLASIDEINFYKSLFNKNDLILEPMCGSGRLLIPLLLEGLTVHGIDHSEAMLKSCKERARELGLSPVLFEDSIENITLPSRYDWLMIPIGSFQLFYPRTHAYKMLEKFKSFLRVNGKLIIDVFVPWDALWENNETEEEHREVMSPDDCLLKFDSINRANKDEQFILSKVTYTKIRNGKVVGEENEEMHICWYYRYEMELILEKYGFKNITYQALFFNSSSRMIFIAESA